LNDYSQPFQGFLFLEEISSVFDQRKPAVFLVLASLITEDSDSHNSLSSSPGPCWRLLFFVRLAIELLTAGSQAADGAGFQLFASRSKKQIPIICQLLGCGLLRSRDRRTLIAQPAARHDQQQRGERSQADQAPVPSARSTIPLALCWSQR